MISNPDSWYPGSFTKNFSWGAGRGLKKLHEAINICFEGKLEPVKRADAIKRLESDGFVWHIPLNFFLLNGKSAGENWLLIDELVYQGITFEHSKHFDKIALIAFLNSYVGEWHGATGWQAKPAPWARQFILENVRNESTWNTSAISANAIQQFIEGSGRYRAKSARKISTNLNFFLKIAGIEELDSQKIERWWVDSMFLVMDRSFSERETEVSSARASQYVLEAQYLRFSGPYSKNKELSIRPLSDLYWACGGLDRWSKDAIGARQTTELPDVHYFANSEDPFYAIYQHDPNIIKVIPRICAMLAKNLTDFEEIAEDQLVDWDPYQYIKDKTKSALDALRLKGVSPNLSAAELLKLTRGK